MFEIPLSRNHQQLWGPPPMRAPQAADEEAVHTCFAGVAEWINQFLPSPTPSTEFRKDMFATALEGSSFQGDGFHKTALASHKTYVRTSSGDAMDPVSINPMDWQGDVKLNVNLKSFILGGHPVHGTIHVGSYICDVTDMGLDANKELVGRGQFGRILVGYDQAGQSIAVKVSSAPQYDQKLMNCLREEALIQLKIQGVSKYLVGARAAGECNGMIFIAMDRLEGEDLCSFSNKKEMFTKEAYRLLALKYALDAARGLEALHQLRIIHGDIKLENIYCDNGTAKLIDFGFARILSGYSNSTNAGSVGGSFGHMAPEVFTHQIVGTHSDVFAFGVMLYNLFSDQMMPGDSYTPDIDGVDWIKFEKEHGEELRYLIESCLCSHIYRPSMSAVVSKLENLLGC